MNRRAFVVTAGAAGSRVLGANERIRGAIIGSGGRGRLLTAQFKEVGAEMVAVCDVYEPNLAAGLKIANTGAKAYDDYRRVLDDKSIDAVVVATPDHWHARMTIDAVEAGKDVYVEKPLAHTIAEGFQMIDAVRRTRRVVQVGTQRRSSDLFIEAKGIMDSGQVGEVRLVNSWWLNRQISLNAKPLEGKLNWKQWMGSTPSHEPDALRFFNWYYFWDYSGGLLVGQAAHIVDAINWFMNATQPLAVTCSAVRPGIPGAEVPETASLSIEYAENFLAVFTLGYRTMHYNVANDQLKQFHGSKARFDVGREGYALYPQSSAVDMQASRAVRRPGSFESAVRAHIRNFLDCVKSRKEPNAPVEAAQPTNIVLCMAMDSLRSGRRLKWNPQLRRVES